MPNDMDILEISCEEVILQISNYLEDDVGAELRARMEEHIRGCKHCAAILDGTSNTVRLLADGKILELPAGFSARLRLRLEAHLR